MTFRAICGALLLSALPIAGCGTVANMANTHPEEGGRTPFGGVRQDMACIRKAANGEAAVRPNAKSNSEPDPQGVLMLVCAADLPFSLIGDLVTWPYTMIFTFVNQPTPVPPVVETPPMGPPQVTP